MKIPNIYITSKGRFEKCKTAEIIEPKNNVFIVVEPKEYNLYKKNYSKHNYLVLDNNDKGLAYCRNYIKRHAEKNNEKILWLLDDDISNFYLRQNTKLIKQKPEYILWNAVKEFQKYNISLGSLEYRQFAWSATKDIILNTFCDCVVYMDLNKLSNIYYNNDLKLKIDRDFCIRTIKDKKITGRLTTYAFSTPPNGSNKGGLKEISYDKDGLEKEMCLYLVKYWGENICKHIVKKDGRNDLKIYWNNINSKQKTLF